jgi:DNA-binding XRE family transcriptional regulator
MSALHNRLAECLAAKKMNQSWLAGRLHMSRAYVSRLARGEVKPSIAVAIRIGRCLGKPVEDIFQLIEDDAKQFPRVSPPMSGESNKPAENKQKPMKGKSV